MLSKPVVETGATEGSPSAAAVTAGGASGPWTAADIDWARMINAIAEELPPAPEPVLRGALPHPNMSALPWQVLSSHSLLSQAAWGCLLPGFDSVVANGHGPQPAEYWLLFTPVDHIPRPIAEHAMVWFKHMTNSTACSPIASAAMRKFAEVCTDDIMDLYTTHVALMKSKLESTWTEAALQETNMQTKLEVFQQPSRMVTMFIAMAYSWVDDCALVRELAEHHHALRRKAVGMRCWDLDGVSCNTRP